MLRSLLSIVAVLALPGLVLAQDAPPRPAADGPDGSLADRVRQAYRDTQQYRADVAFTVEQQVGRITQIQKMDFYIAFDRAGQRLSVDKPDLHVVVDGGMLRMVTEQARSHYVETPIADPLTWEALAAAMPPITHPSVPDVTMLLAADPAAALGGPGATIAAGTEPGTLTLRTKDGPMTLHIDPDTYLIDSAVVQLTGFASPGQTAQLTYDFDVLQHDAPIAPEAFQIDAKGRQVVTSLNQLMSELQRAAAAGGGGAMESDHPLVGKATPKVTFKTTDGETHTLGETGHRVVVLDFWGTWCGPCHLWLPSVQSVHDWAQREKLSVLVVAVDVGDEPADALAFWENKGYTMPLTLDEDGAMFGAFAPPVFPQTFVIVDGTVRFIHSGVSTEQSLRDQITAALADDVAAPNDKAASPAGGAPRAPGT